MAERVFLHVGAPKSGTTYLQTLLWHNRERLATAGTLVAGEHLFDLNRAAKALRKGSMDASAGAAGQVWERLVGQVGGWSGDAILSNEWFSLVPRNRAREALACLEPAELHIVFTARAAVHQVPAAWQETLKLGQSQSLGSFIRDLDQPRQRWSWWTLDAAEVLHRWGSTLPPHRVHVVTVPPRGSEPQLLWKRFAQVCGIAPDLCDTRMAVSNESLGVESARLLQEIGPDLRAAVDADTAHWTEPYRWLRRYVGHELLVPLGGRRISLRPEDLRLLQERSARSRAALVAAGYDVVGDLAELDQPMHPDGVHPDDLDTADMLDVMRPLAAALLRRVRDETLRADRAEARVAELSGGSSK